MKQKLTDEKSISLWLPWELHRKVQQKLQEKMSKGDRMSLSSLVRELLKRWVE